MNINQKAIRLLQQIVNGRKEYCNGYFVYKPQLEADVVDKLYAEFLVEYCKLKDYHSKLRSFSASISRCSNGIYPGTGRITGEIRNNIYDFVSPGLASTAQDKGGNTMREKLASLAHEMWSEWMKYLFSKCIQPTYTSTLIIPASAVNRWSRQMKTPYSELSEEEKESDRREADRMLECISVLDSHSYGAKKWYESREGILKRWDIWRRYIASGGKSSWPRDEFESLLDYLLTRLSPLM